MRLVYSPPAYEGAELSSIRVTLEEGETLGNFHGPAIFDVSVVEGNTEYDDIVRRGLLIEPPET